MNNNNNNFNKTNRKKNRICFIKNKDKFFKTKILVNNQINDYISSNISISNSCLTKILENSNPAYSIANISLTSPTTMKKQKSKKKKIVILILIILKIKMQEKVLHF